MLALGECDAGAAVKATRFSGAGGKGDRDRDRRPAPRPDSAEAAAAEIGMQLPPGFDERQADPAFAKSAAMMQQQVCP